MKLKTKYYEHVQAKVAAKNKEKAFASVSASTFMEVFDSFASSEEVDVQVLDVRDADEVALSKLPDVNVHGAKIPQIFVPLCDVLADPPRVVRMLDTSKRIFTLCYIGGRSGEACEVLAHAGVKTTNIEGGIENLHRLRPKLIPYY